LFHEADGFYIFRQQVLRIWKDKMLLGATYRNLLRLFIKAGHADGANAVIQVLNKRAP
jgi:hypothetical protein